MLIPLNEIIKNYSLNIKGIVHIGAHEGQEYPIYKSQGIDNIIFVEPSYKAYGELINTISDESVMFFNCACGAYNGIATMITESDNNGMSNSLLQPKKHLEQHPTIKFTGTQDVMIRRLDELEFEKSKYNFLVADVQGYELEVLKGASNTLPYIDYLYLEVNRDEVYEGCAKVWDLDKFLHNYKRVETKWIGNWGDALYIKSVL